MFNISIVWPVIMSCRDFRSAGPHIWCTLIKCLNLFKTLSSRRGFVYQLHPRGFLVFMWHTCNCQPRALWLTDKDLFEILNRSLQNLIQTHFRRNDSEEFKKNMLLKHTHKHNNNNNKYLYSAFLWNNSKRCIKTTLHIGV